MAEKFELAKDEYIVSMIQFGTRILLATNKALYHLLSNKEIEKLELYIEKK